VGLGEKADSRDKFILETDAEKEAEPPEFSSGDCRAEMKPEIRQILLPLCATIGREASESSGVPFVVPAHFDRVI
jgi:hypothetical protein